MSVTAKGIWYPDPNTPANTARDEFQSLAESVDLLLDEYQAEIEKGANNGYASLDGDGKVPSSQLPDPVAAGVQVLDSVVSTTTIVNSAAEANLYSFLVPGGTLAAEKALRLTVAGDFFNNSGTSRNFTLRIKFGATTMLDLFYTASTVAVNRGKWKFTIDLAGETTSAQRVSVNGPILAASADAWQSASGGSNLGSLGYGTAAENATVDKTLAFTAQLSAAHASYDIRLHMATLELL